MNEQPIALTIAGFDPSSGAGATADLMTFAAHGLFGTSCLTSLTVQSTLGVVSSQAISADYVSDCLRCLEADLPPVGIKVGMLGTAAVVEAVVEYLTAIRLARPGILVVLDPVLRSSSGRELLDAAGFEAMQSSLLPLVDWVTPNLAELAVLTRSAVVCRRDAITEQACQLKSFGKKGLQVLAKGGHLDSSQPPDDLLLTADCDAVWLAGEWIDTTATHGTGCALASALLSRLVLGDQAEKAARTAKAYVAEAMRTAPVVGHGHGPMNLLWPIRG